MNKDNKNRKVSKPKQKKKPQGKDNSEVKKITIVKQENDTRKNDRRDNTKEQEEKNKRKKKLDKQKKEKVSTLGFLTELALNKATKGSLDIQGSDFEISYAKVLSETHQKRIIAILEYPIEVKAGHLEGIRKEVFRDIPPYQRKDIQIDISEHSIQHNIPVINNKKFKSAESNFRRQLSVNINDRNTKEAARRAGASTVGLSKDDPILLRKRIKRLERKVDSFGTVERNNTRGSKMVKTYTFVEISASNAELLEMTADKVQGVLAINNYKYKDVMGDVEKYLKSFGLGNLRYSKQIKDTPFLAQTLTTEITSLSTTYSEGIIRSKQGDIYFGHSIATGYPFHLSFSESTDAANILIVADSGSGKTVFIKTVALFAMNHKDTTYNLIINDYKGNEYLAFSRFDNSIKIPFGMDNPRFVNTLIIPDYKKYNLSEPEVAYQLAVASTEKRLRILVGQADIMQDSKTQSICGDIVKRIYLNNSVDIRKPETYKNINDLDFRDVIWEQVMFVTSESKDFEVRHGSKALQYVKTQLEPYFSPYGTKRYVFQNPISLDELMDLKIIVFDYGTQTASSSMVLSDKDIEEKIFQKDYITNLYSSVNKLKRQYTMEFDEEVQRKINNPLLLKALSSEISGSRSNNKINVLVTNSVAGFLDSKERDASAIRDNLNTVILGRCKPEVAEDVIRHFSLQTARDRIDGVLRGSGPFKNSFLCAVNTGTFYDMVVTSMRLPPKLLESDMYMSKDIENGIDLRIQ